MGRLTDSDSDRWGAPGAVADHRDGWVSVDFPEQNLTVSVRTGEVDGLPQVVGLRVEQSCQVPGDAPQVLQDFAAHLNALVAREGGLLPTAITPRKLRALPLGQVRETALRHRPGLFSAGAPDWGAPSRGPQPVPLAKLERVAEIYRDSVDHGQKPIPAICQEVGIKRKTALSYVRRARDRGLLGWPLRAGKPGYRSDRSPWGGSGVQARPKRPREEPA